MSGVTLAICCAVFIALSTISLRKSYREFKPSVAFFINSLLGLALWVPLGLIMGVHFQIGFEQAFFYAFLSAVLSEAIVFYALSHGELAVTATILGTYPVYTVLFSRLINDEVLSNSLLLFVAIAIIGSVIASLPEKLTRRELKLRKEIVWPFVAAVSIGLSDTLSKGYINRSEDFSLLFALGFMQIPVALIYLRLEKQHIRQTVKTTVRNFRAYKHAIIGGILNVIGVAFLWLSFSYAPASIASPITGSNGALTVVLAWAMLSEKLLWWRYIGIMLAFVGVIGIVILTA